MYVFGGAAGIERSSSTRRHYHEREIGAYSESGYRDDTRVDESTVTAVDSARKTRGTRETRRVCCESGTTTVVDHPAVAGSCVSDFRQSFGRTGWRGRGANQHSLDVMVRSFPDHSEKRAPRDHDSTLQPSLSHEGVPSRAAEVVDCDRRSERRESPEVQTGPGLKGGTAEEARRKTRLGNRRRRCPRHLIHLARL